jgi:hypothetical protein
MSEHLSHDLYGGIRVTVLKRIHQMLMESENRFDHSGIEVPAEKFAGQAGVYIFK